jgi:O-Antigen ligase
MQGPTVAPMDSRVSRVPAGRGWVQSDAGLDARVPLIATVLAVALVPFLTPGGPAGIAPVDLFIAIAAVAVMVWASVGVKIRAPYAAPVAVLLVAGAAGALAGPVPTAGLLALSQDMWLLAWAIVVANVARSPTGLRLILRAWVIASVAWATVGLIGVVAGIPTFAGLAANEGGRISIRFGDPNYAANYFVVSIMLIWATSYPRPRVLRTCAYGVLIAAWIFTGSNSGIVSLLIGVTAASILGIRRRWGVVPMVAASCLVLLTAFAVAPHVSLGGIQRAAQASRYQVVRDWVGRSPSSIEDRSLLLHESVGLYYQGGLLGEGPGSTKPRLTDAQAPFVKEAHDDYFAALTERGVIGVLGLLLLVASVLVRTMTVAIRPLRPEVEAIVPRPNALAGAILGTLVSSTVYELLHVRHVWTLFAIVAAIYIWGRE